MASVMPVSSVIAGGIGAEGSLKDWKMSVTPVIASASEYRNLTMASSITSSLARIEAGGLGVEDDAGLAGLAFARRARRARHQPAKDFVVAARLEGGGHPVQIFRAVQRIGLGGVEHGGFRGCC